ncbi:hypothetical protein COOONC_12731 [Cooperia oncophora]
MSRPSRRLGTGEMNKFAIDLAVGGVSAAVSKTAVAPLERIKLLLQVRLFPLPCGFLGPLRC